jgi:hypothetical protein
MSERILREEMRVTHLIPTGRGNWQYTLDAQSKGALERIPVTVKWFRKHRKLACLTCNGNDCAHTRFVASVQGRDGEPPRMDGDDVDVRERFGLTGIRERGRASMRGEG